MYGRAEKFTIYGKNLQTFCRIQFANSIKGLVRLLI